MGKTPQKTSKEPQADLEQSGEVLFKVGLHGERPRRTLLSSEKSKMGRLIYATSFIDRSQSFWNDVLWTDETKIELFGNAVH